MQFSSRLAADLGEAMQESAFEKALSGAITGAGDWIRQHDRFVVIGLVFSLLPLPPACFVGVLISLVNLALLRNRSLDAGESGPIRLALSLGSVNCAVVILIMVWLNHHLHVAASGVNLPYLPDYLNALLSHAVDYLNWLYDTGAHKGMVT